MRKGHRFTVVEGGSKKYMAVMVLSDHDSSDEAWAAIMDAMKTEGDVILKETVEDARKKGVNAVTVEEVTKDMTPEQLEKFLKERQRKFINPLMDANIKTLETKGRQLKIKRIK